MVSLAMALATLPHPNSDTGASQAERGRGGGTCLAFGHLNLFPSTPNGLLNPDIRDPSCFTTKKRGLPDSSLLSLHVKDSPGQNSYR